MMIATWCRAVALAAAWVFVVAGIVQANPIHEVDLASDTAWTLQIDGGPPRSIRVPGGGWNSDLQCPRIDTMSGVRDHVVYQRTITIPAVAKGQCVKVLFGAVNYGAEVTIDGRRVAEHAGPLTPFAADLTGIVQPGRAYTLAVKAYHRRHYYTGKMCDVPVGFDFPAGSKQWCEWDGNTKFAYGITKHVRLAVYPAVHIEDVYVKPSVGKDCLNAVVWLRNTTAQARTVTLSGSLSSWNKADWKYPAMPEVKCTIPAGKTARVELGPVRWKLGSASYWWPNIPFREDYAATLHVLRLELAEAGRVWHASARRFGFCEHAEGPFYYTVNGVRVTNISDGTVESQMSHYDCYSTSAAFLPAMRPNSGCPETWRRYLRIGINTNRICCSMPTEAMMDAADEVGFMLMPEAVTWGNNLSRYHEVYSPQVVREMARLCRNHPSVVRYSLTNEVREPMGKDWPWRALIDAILDEDDLRPLVYELHGFGVGRIDGVRRGHAYINSHYGSIDPGGDFIRGMGEHCWETDGMAAFGHAAQQFRINDWAYFAPWSWLNFWPNFLEGMNHDQHAWKANNAPDRRDGINGWNSPIVRFVQRAAHPYLLVDHEMLRTNPPRKREIGDGRIEWPYRIPAYAPGETVERKIEVFNGGLQGEWMSLAWSARWDRVDGPLAAAGETIGPFEVRPGFHTTRVIRFRAPAATSSRRLYMILEAMKDGQRVNREDRLYFTIARRDEVGGVARLPTPSARFLQENDEARGDWRGRFGAEGYDIAGRPAKLPLGVSITWGGEEAAVVGTTWQAADAAQWTWEAKTDDARALQAPDAAAGRTRIAACRYGNPLVFTVDVGRTPRKVTLYLLDWDQNGVRRHCVELRAPGGNLLDQRTIENFGHGKHLSWTIAGRVEFNLQNLRGNNAVVSAVFFDPADRTRSEQSKR